MFIDYFIQFLNLCQNLFFPTLPLIWEEEYTLGPKPISPRQPK